MTRRQTLTLLAVTLLALAAAAAQAATARARPAAQDEPIRQSRSNQPPAFLQSRIIWRGDYENGFEGWNLHEVSKASPSYVGENSRDDPCRRARDFSGEDRLRIVTSPVRQGRYAARFVVYNGDRPICSTGNRVQHLRRSVNESEGDENYYKWSTMLAPDFPFISDTWQIITQWHGPGGGTQPPVYVFVEGNAIGFRTVEHDSRGQSLASRTFWRAPINRGKWHDFVAHIRWSFDRSEGFVELWHRLEGERQYTQVVPKIYGRTLVEENEGVYFVPGYYRGPHAGSPGVVYHDGWTQMEVS
jgi:polysaccharide lyase-like protein